MSKFYAKICTTLSEPLEGKWLALVKACLGEGVHQDRIMSFCLAREALRLLLSEQGEKADPDHLILENYHSLRGFPEWTVSLSHTKGAGAALIMNKTEILSIGVDIERDDRPVNPEVIRRVSHPHDANLRNIELWCLKEAAYKCLSNSGKIPSFVFSEINIREDGWVHSPTGIQGTWEISTPAPFVLAKAFLKN